MDFPDVTLLSSSSIGSPNLASTAVKPPIGVHTTSTGDSSLLTGVSVPIHKNKTTSEHVGNIPGRLSLGSSSAGGLAYLTSPGASQTPSAVTAELNHKPASAHLDISNNFDLHYSTSQLSGQAGSAAVPPFSHCNNDSPEMVKEEHIQIPHEYLEKSDSISSSSVASSCHCSSEGSGSDDVEDSDIHSLKPNPVTIPNLRNIPQLVDKGRLKDLVSNSPHRQTASQQLSFRTSARYQLSLEGGEATPLAEEEEPTLMFEADEFSLFEPSHLDSMMNRESFIGRASSEPSGQQEVGIGKKVATSPAGRINRSQERVKVLPPANVSVIEEEESKWDDRSPSPPGITNGGTQLPLQGMAQSPINHSVGTEGLSAYLVPSTPLDPSLALQDSSLNEHAHNPFDSESSSAQSFQHEFEVQDKEEFLNDLAREEEIADKFAKSADSLQTTFTVPSADTSRVVVTGSCGKQEVSVLSYFQQKSYALGALASDQVPATLRPQFAQDHEILSPPGVTLDPRQVAATVGGGTSSSTLAMSDLTPAITTHSPLFTQLSIPRLDLTNISAASHDTKPPITEPLTISPSGGGSISDNQSVTSVSFPLSPVAVSISTTAPWSYHHSIDSTLRFSEVSVPSLTPTMALRHQLNLQSPPSYFPTPSVGHLTHLFDVTEVATSVASQPSVGQSPPVVGLNQQLLEGRVSASSTSHSPVITVSGDLTVRDDSVLTSSKSECSTKEEEDKDCFEQTNGVLLGHREVSQEPSVEQEHVVRTNPGVVIGTESMEVSSQSHISSTDHSFPATSALLSPVTSSTSRLAQIKASLDTNRSDAESFLAMLNKSSASSRTLSLSCSVGQAHTLISSSPLSGNQSSPVTDTRAGRNFTLPPTDVLPVMSFTPDQSLTGTDTTTSGNGGVSLVDALPITPFAPDQSSAVTDITAGSSGVPLTSDPLVTDLARLGMSTGKQVDADPQSSSVDITSSTIQEHVRSSSSSPSSPVSYGHAPSPHPQDSHSHTHSSRSSSSFSISSRETPSRQEHAEESGGLQQAEFPSIVPTSSVGFSVNSKTTFALSHQLFSEPLPFTTVTCSQAASDHSSFGSSSGIPIPSTNPVMYTPLYTAPLINGSTHLTSVATAGLMSPPANPLLSPVHVHVPDRVVFSEVSCVGTVQHCQLTLSNPSARWVQCNIKTASLLKDGEQVRQENYKTFSYPAKCFIGPHKSESVKLNFSPVEDGFYQAVLKLFSCLVTDPGGSDHAPIASVTVIAQAEKPRIQVITGSNSSSLLDFGTVLSGKTATLPLHLVNHGKASIPLCLTMATSSPAWFCYSFESVPEDLLRKGSPNLQGSTHSSIRILLPPKLDEQVEPVLNTLGILFRAPAKSTDDRLGVGPLEDCCARLDVYVDGPNAVSSVCSVALNAVTGVIRLHAPKTMQFVSLLCGVGQSTSRTVPIKNAGNLPVTVNFEIKADRDFFFPHPSILQLAPGEESQVQIRFTPSSGSSSTDGTLLMHVTPDGPSFKIRLRGTADDCVYSPYTNVLECSQQFLFWAGAKAGQASCQELLLHNEIDTSILLQLSVRNPAEFQLQCGEEAPAPVQQVVIGPQERLAVQVFFTPSCLGLSRTDLDILNTIHSRHYQLPLCGYAGSSNVAVLNCSHTASGFCASLGEVAVGRRSVVKLRVTNTGQRAAFVKVLPSAVGHTETVLPVDKLSVSPSELILQPQQTMDLLVIYHSQEADLELLSLLSASRGEKYQSGGAPLAKLTVLTGDELMRQLVCHGPAQHQGDPLVHLASPFPGQEAVTEGWDVPLPKNLSVENLFMAHLRTITVALVGYPPGSLPSPLPSSPTPAHTNGLTSTNLPAQQCSSLPPPHAPGPVKVNSRVLPQQTLSFPDTPVQHYSEKFLEVCNPYPVPVSWHLQSVGPSFVRGVATSLCKAKYSAFWVHQCSGSVSALGRTAVLVTFQPQDAGTFSQMWNLKISGEGLGVMGFQLSLGGKATVGSLPNPETVILRHHPALGNADNATDQPALPTCLSSTTSLRPHWQTVYLSPSSVVFPVTKIGEQSVVKIKVCNKDTHTHQFEVIQPQPPFSVVHYHFTLTPRHCARLPVYFTPTAARQTLQGVLAVRTSSGHQMFAILSGSSPS